MHIYIYMYIYNYAHKVVSKENPFDLFSELVIQLCFRNAAPIYDDVIQYISVNSTKHLVHGSWSTHQAIAPAVS